MWRSGLVCVLMLGLVPPLHAQTPPADASLPSVKPRTLQALSDNRVRQRMMLESQAHYPGRCVCPAQATDSKGRSCKGRHEAVTTKPRPLCRPAQVTPEMVAAWRHPHP